MFNPTARVLLRRDAYLRAAGHRNEEQEAAPAREGRADRHGSHRPRCVAARYAQGDGVHRVLFMKNDALHVGALDGRDGKAA